MSETYGDLEEATVLVENDDEAVEAEDAAGEPGEDGAAQAAETPEAGSEAAPGSPEAIEEFREALRRAPGEWYVIHSYAGYENRVKQNLETRMTTLNMEEFIFQVDVPMEEVV